MPTRRFGVVFVAAPHIASLLFIFADAEARRATPSDGADLRLGRTVYQKACEECHGSKGRGDGRKAKELGFAPRNFTLGAFKCRCTPSGQPPTDEDLYRRTLTTGMTGSPMPSFEAALGFAKGDFTPENLRTLGGPNEAKELLAYLEGQPDAATVKPMGAQERRALVSRRTWALVQHLRWLLTR